MRWRAAFGVAAVLAAAVAFFAVLLLTLYPPPRQLDAISSRVVAGGFRLPAFETESNFPHSDVLDLLPTAIVETSAFLKDSGFEPLRNFVVDVAKDEKVSDNSFTEISPENSPLPHSIPEMPAEEAAASPASFIVSVPYIAPAAKEAVRTYYSKVLCHDGVFYSVGIALDFGGAAELLQAKAFLTTVGFDMCG